MPAARWGFESVRILRSTMRMIGTIPRGEDAERFSDYLLTQNIDNMVEERLRGEGMVGLDRAR